MPPPEEPRRSSPRIAFRSGIKNKNALFLPLPPASKNTTPLGDLEGELQWLSSKDVACPGGPEKPFVWCELMESGGGFSRARFLSRCKKQGSPAPTFMDMWSFTFMDEE